MCLKQNFFYDLVERNRNAQGANLTKPKYFQDSSNPDFTAVTALFVQSIL